MPVALFVYGTLHPDHAPAEIRDTVLQMRLIGPATIRGEVRDLGEYPALLPHSRQGVVPGTLFALPVDPAVLKSLDAYEGYDPRSPETSLFLRRKRAVMLPDGRRERHWVYVYNREVPASSRCVGASELLYPSARGAAIAPSSRPLSPHQPPLR